MAPTRDNPPPPDNRHDARPDHGARDGHRRDTESQTESQSAYLRQQQRDDAKPGDASADVDAVRPGNTNAPADDSGP